MAGRDSGTALAALFGFLGLCFVALTWFREPDARESALPVLRSLQSQHQAASRVVGKVVAPLTPGQERELGRSIDARMSSPLAPRWDLQPIGRRLAGSPLVRRYPGDYTFRVLPGGTNAFAVPGGFVYVLEGLAERFDGRPDLMAFVLAHEIGHVELGHCADSVRYRALADQLGVGLAGEMAQILHRLSELNYSEVQEREADAFAMRLLKDRDLRASAGAEAIRAMIPGDIGRPREPGELVTEVLFDYLRTHPTSYERIAELERLAR